MTPNARLASALLAAGWAQTMPSKPDAYRRDGSPYLTWRKGAVTIASSATERRYNPSTGAVEAWVAFSGASVTIEVLQTEAASRCAGAAREALTEWIALARAAGVGLYLEPCPQEPGVSRERLVAFYKAAGFEPADGNAAVMVLAADVRPQG
jgi:hypothetical protein